MKTSRASGLCVLVLVSVCVAAGPPRGGVAETGGRTIYEANIRQHTPEGTFDAFRVHIPRLADLGVGVLWLMPIHPIGEENRKGSLGSYYAPSDYLAVNPEFGTKEDLRELVDAAHEAGMLVILDWVANHTAWDHVWTERHPERFTKGEDGGFTAPNDSWLDVIDLDFDRPGTRRGMREAMVYWVREFGIDGYRCDVAEAVPREFWEEAIERLRRVRPVFMLAEGKASWLHDAGFDATYGWGLGDALLSVAQGECDAAGVRAVIEGTVEALGARGDGAFRMHFTTNHDWNSWNGTAVERFGAAWEAATVVTFTAPGMPLVYGGQEAGLDEQLEFFEKDEVVWRAHPASELYRKLALRKEREAALHHGRDTGAIEFLDAGDESRVLAFRRWKGESEVVVVVNLSDREANVEGVELEAGATYVDLDGFPAGVPERLGAWGWMVMVRGD